MPVAFVGVQTWSVFDCAVKEVRRDGSEHEVELRYNSAMGIDENFYWFTLEAALADDMHWMSTVEASRFGIATNAVAQFGQGVLCEDR